MKEIRTAIIGEGNCASSLVRGRFYCADPEADVPGLITQNFGGHHSHHIRCVAAFDVAREMLRRYALGAEEPVITTAAHSDN